MTDSDIDNLKEKHQSTATKKNTQWCKSLVQGMRLIKYCLQISFMVFLTIRSELESSNTARPGYSKLTLRI